MSKCNHTFHRLGGIEDCPVCNPQPPAKPPREFWILKVDEYTNRALVRTGGEKWPDDVLGAPSEKWTHVIEKSYFDELQAKYNFMVDSAQQNARERNRLEQELAFAKNQWKQTSDLLEQERNRLTAELADVRKEWDELKEKLKWYSTFVGVPNPIDVKNFDRDQAQAAALAGELAVAYENAATVALEQRCEQGTQWDLACTTIAEKIRAAYREFLKGRE